MGYQFKMAVRQVLFMMPPVQNRKPRVFRAIELRANLLTNEELRKRYRFGREGINYITELVRENLERGTNKKTALTVEQQVMITLRYFASGSFMQVIGDTLGYDKGTVSRVGEDVTDALLAKRNDFIKWPAENDQKRTKCAFYDVASFPNVIGCIDCTHVKIVAPSEDEPAFVNRKGYHSINVQAVCNHEGKFTNICANWPGSVHDSHIFRTSNLCQHLETNHRDLLDGVLLGDSGYACRPLLLTPYSNPQEQRQQRFNRAHTSTRCAIERSFGIWKRRFHILHSEIRLKPQKVCRVIVACAILHNIAVLLREPLIDNDEDHDQEPVPVPPFAGVQDGRSVRDHISRYFF